MIFNERIKRRSNVMLQIRRKEKNKLMKDSYMCVAHCVVGAALKF